MKNLNTKKMTLAAVVIGILLLVAFFANSMQVSAGEDLASENNNGLVGAIDSIDVPMIPGSDITDIALGDTSASNNNSNDGEYSIPVRKPSLTDLYKEEDNLADYVGETVTGDDLTAEEVVEVIEIIEELPAEELDMSILAKLPEITVSNVVDAVDVINNERTSHADADLAAGIRNDTPDVGTSNVAHAEETTAPTTEVRSNETTSVATTDNGVAIKVEDNRTTTIATKTMVKVYGPAGYTAEYECGETVWSNIPLNGGYGSYTINVYQDTDGNGYKFVSQSREYKAAPVSTSSYSSSHDDDEDEDITTTTVSGTYVAPDFSRLESEDIEVSEPETTSAPEAASVVVEEPVVETTPVVEETAPATETEPEAPVVEDGMDFDDLLAGLGL